MLELDHHSQYVGPGILALRPATLKRQSTGSSSENTVQTTNTWFCILSGQCTLALKTQFENLKKVHHCAVSVLLIYRIYCDFYNDKMEIYFYVQDLFYLNVPSNVYLT